ncbi:Brain-specific angiogenesis inhibitor 1-associated protein 2-like protein 1 [Pteropus alecto]|uniref:BAR/IMD domain-containing adapter protein 2-like 1 n=1 Tax=Pteropus alecto TaxID=9402 RepID=L5L2D6_PTEAL|nr:Brain-specific angiogenesis inhibitor 1-associated protein 2-like protein 1 [Pteropus alecto]
MEQFNPRLRNLINLGKNYEKAVNAMILAGKAYYDEVVKIGELATRSPVSTELVLGFVRINSVTLTTTVVSAAQKRNYLALSGGMNKQTESQKPELSSQDLAGHVLIEISSTHKKLDESLKENFKTFHKEIIHELEKKTELDVKYMNATLKRYQTEHKNKLDSLEKSQAELKKIRRKSQGGRNALKYEHKEFEYVETVTSRQSEIQKFIADGCREALLEEKRRFCFLVDKHCSFANHIHYYHVQSAELLNSKLPRWQETCRDATKVPEEIINMIEEIKTPVSTPKSGTPHPSPMIERSNMVDDPSLQRSVSVATGLNMMKKQKVKTIFPHTAGTNQTLLSFAQGDVITLLISEEKDGWLYGEHDASKVRGWFPSSYTKLLEENAKEAVNVPSPSPAPVRSMSTVDLTEKACAAIALPPPDYSECLARGTDVSKPPSTFKAPASKPETASPNNTNGTAKPPFLSGENPFATVKLRPTVTNDRSAPIIR